MALLSTTCAASWRTLRKNNIRFRVIGRPTSSPPRAARARRGSRGARRRTPAAVQHRALLRRPRRDRRRGAPADARPAIEPADIDERRFASLYTAGLPDPDLLIRTCGEMRVSNFLLWQIAYAEIWVTDTLWPDFRAPHLLEAVLDYQKRERRYGGVKASRVAGGSRDPRSERGGAAGRGGQPGVVCSAAGAGRARRRRRCRRIHRARAARRGAWRPRAALPGVIITAAPPCWPRVAWPGVPLQPVLVASVVAAAAMAIAGGRPDRRPDRRRGDAGGGAALSGASTGGAAGIRWTDGREAAVLLVLVVVASDTLHYYAGRALGRRKLAPVISPKKTVEGAVGGFVGATLVMAFAGRGVASSRAAQRAHRARPTDRRPRHRRRPRRVGAEARRRREGQLTLIPGHGGVLDRIDALLLAAPGVTSRS